MRSLKIAAAGTALMILLSGCMRMNMELTVNGDDTVNGSMVVAFDKKLLEQAGTTADEVLAQQGLGTSTEPGVTTTPYEQDGFVGSKITFANQKLSELGKATSSGATGEELMIKRKGDQLITTGSMDMTSAVADEASGLTQAMLDTFDISVSITYPGEVVSTTGEVDGNTVTWHIPAGTKINFDTVVNAPFGSSTGSKTNLLLPIAGGAALLAVVLVVVLRRRTKTAASTDSEPPTEA